MDLKPGTIVRVGELFLNHTQGQYVFTLKEKCNSPEQGSFWTTEEGLDLYESDILEVVSNVTSLSVVKEQQKVLNSLIPLSEAYDDVSQFALENGEEIPDIAGIMANRLGELVRIYKGDKEGLKNFLFNIIHDRAYLRDEE